MQTVRRARRPLRVALADLFWRVSRRILRCEVVLVMAVELDEPWKALPPHVPDRPGLTFRWLDQQSLSVLRAPHLGYDSDEAFDRSLARLERGHRCLAGFLDGKPVTYLWATESTREVVGDELKLDERHVWIYKCFTRPDWRRQGLTQLLGRHALDGYMADGKDVALVDMMQVNRPSIAAFLGIGFRPLGRFTVRAGPDGQLAGQVPNRLVDRIMSLPSKRSSTPPAVPPTPVAEADKRSV
jgi:GNAT superfamily N-acetyltransferase